MGFLRQIIFEKVILLDDFYQNFFSKDRMSESNPSASGSPFHGLYDTSITLGGYAYRIALMLVLYGAVITLLMHVAKLVLSMNGQATAEAKAKIMRVFFIALFAGMICGAVAIIVKAFAV